MSNSDLREIYQFGGFQVDRLRRSVYFDGDQLPLTPKAFDTLLVLIGNSGRVVSKNELIDAIWGDTVVEENNLTQQIATLRRTFGERAGEHRFIITLPGNGYSFVAPVVKTEIGVETEAVLVKGSRSSVAIEIDSGLSLNLRDRYNRSGSLGALIAVLYILIVFTVSIFSAAGGQKVSVQRQTVAVLGFRASDVNDEALGTGIRDTLRARIGNLKEITLRPEGPSVTQNGILTAGREAKAEIVFTGSIQHIEDRVRVAVEMVDVEHERVVWGKTFDYNGPDRFFVQDAIADEVLKVLGRTRSDVAAGRL